MATFRVNKDKNYTTINNTGLRDERLTWKAKGILAYILSLPDDWVFYMEEVATHAKDKLDSLKSGMKELKEHGYIKRFPVKDEKGKIIRWETIIYEIPQVENPPVENPLVGKPQVDEPPVENPMLLNTKELSTNKQNTNLQSSSNSIFAFYENNFGVLNPFMADNIEQWVKDTSKELVIAAMERALKQQKKWKYAEGILKQWANNNIKTLNDVKALETEYKNRNKGAKHNDPVASNGNVYYQKTEFDF
ncbi:DnaD domain protein [Bacillus cereus group sp. Bc222]|uniref:DnaD domain protein n=1 Tax=Bacillus TaxID=1386 RepID=UPI000C293C1F|nr:MULTISPECIES: DnaD domain protein [Bacillus]AYY25286.1 DnaD domain protein [Bacillus sp. FDAARGOS_527]MCC2436379.1 DnaD domain protein [Bacillus paranthracis]MDA2013062.1 DnaD domain protein [Bacillus cereus group sp. Bcc09]MDA2242075.1 DnaD domain protein [Bacillus cereus group sp. Bc222]MDX5829382.1 DnaD domain protein [Bacillus cereus group sp. BfR-BA-02147]